MVTGRDDTATDGTVWAKDTLTRTVTVNRQSAAEADKCGTGAVKCFFYTATLKDNGTFATVADAHSPNTPNTPINGQLSGTIDGVYELEFYASSGAPDPSLVDKIVTGTPAGYETGNWVKNFFPDDTKFSAIGGIDYKWVYTAPTTCEEHIQATAGNTGNITGVNACTAG
jgi:hypothetical protein